MCKRHRAFTVLSIANRREEQRRCTRHRALPITNRRDEQRRCRRHRAFTQSCQSLTEGRSREGVQGIRPSHSSATNRKEEQRTCTRHRAFTYIGPGMRAILMFQVAKHAVYMHRPQRTKREDLGPKRNRTEVLLMPFTKPCR